MNFQQYKIEITFFALISFDDFDEILAAFAYKRSINLIKELQYFNLSG